MATIKVIYLSFLFRVADSQHLALSACPPVCPSGWLCLLSKPLLRLGWRHDSWYKCTHVYYMCTSVLVYMSATVPGGECALQLFYDLCHTGFFRGPFFPTGKKTAGVTKFCIGSSLTNRIGSQYILEGLIIRCQLLLWALQ